MDGNEGKRVTKEYKLKNERHPKIQTRYGATNKNNPEVVYIRTKARITPLSRRDDYSDAIVEIKASLARAIRDAIEDDSRLENRHITTVEISEKSITFGKKSNAKYDIFIKPVNKKGIDQYYGMVEGFMDTVNGTFERLLRDNGIALA